MGMSRRLEKIRRENEILEAKTPYNFCDRWCERCTSEKKMRCTIYQQELEQDMLCIAHGKEPGDPEITEAVMKRQFDEIEKRIEESLYEERFDDECDDDFDDEFDEDIEVMDIEELEERVDNDSLMKTVKQYSDMSHAFLKKEYYGKNKKDLAQFYSIINWYHLMLSVKINLALSGFYEYEVAGELSLYDAVAQLDISKKAIRLSRGAYHLLLEKRPDLKPSIIPLMALLENLNDRILMLEDSI